MDGCLCHAKVITIAAGATSSITCTGANGSLISCNTAHLSVSDAGAAGYILVVPSGVSQFPAIAIGNGASGTYGHLFDTKETHHITLGAGRNFSALTFTNLSSAAKTVIANYGIKYKLPDMDRGYSPQI